MAQSGSIMVIVIHGEAPDCSPTMPRTARHKSTLRGGAAVLPPTKGGGGAANTAKFEKRWQTVQRRTFYNTAAQQPAAAPM